MSKKPNIASFIVGSAVSAVAAAALTARKSSAATTSQLPTPAPSNLPHVPSVPTEQPKPRATPKEFAFTALHRYDIEADVLPVDGVGLRAVATKALAHLYFDDASLKTYRSVQRPGVGEVTRVRFVANSLINNRVAFDRQIAIAGVGSVWLVSAKEVGL